MPKHILNNGHLQVNKGKNHPKQPDWWGAINIDGTETYVQGFNIETLFQGQHSKGIRIEKSKVRHGDQYIEAPYHFECNCFRRNNKENYTGRFVTRNNAYTISIWKNESKRKNEYLSVTINPIDVVKSVQLQMDVAEQERADRGEHLPKGIINLNNKPF